MQHSVGVVASKAAIEPTAPTTILRTFENKFDLILAIIT
jgi:hypothetical protein